MIKKYFYVGFSKEIPRKGEEYDLVMVNDYGRIITRSIPELKMVRKINSSIWLIRWADNKFAFIKVINR